MNGESVDLPEQSVKDWLNILESNILTNYVPENILNSDESSLFWLFRLDKTMTFRTEKVHGCKKSKERITILHGVSMSGEKFPLLVIGKYSKPRCFKNILNLPVIYRAKKFLDDSRYI